MRPAPALLLTLLLGAPMPAAAQAPARLGGRVTDATTGAPLPGAEVLVGDRRAVSGPDGAWRIGAAAPGRRELTVRRPGYTPFVETVELLPGLERTVDIALRPMPVVLDELLVRVPAGGLEVRGEELARRGADLGTALDGWEGIVVRRDAAAGPAVPQVRGGAPDEVVVLVDGFPINDPLTGRADLRRVATASVDRVRLVPGAQSSVAGGRALAGVIMVETRPHIAPEVGAWASSYGGRGTRLGASVGPSVVAALQLERTADHYPYTIPPARDSLGGAGGERDGVRENAGGTLWSGSVRANGPLEIVARASGGRRGLPGPITNPTPTARAEDASALLGVRHAGALEAAASVEWLESRARDSAPPVGRAYDSYTRGMGIGASLGLHRPAALGAWRGEAGGSVEGRADRFGGDGVQPGASFDRAALRLDASFRNGAGSVWTISPVVRLDVWSGRTTPALSGRIDGSWQRGGTSVTVGAGSAVSPPALADLLFREDVGVRLNPELRPERVRWEVEAGLRRELGADVIASVRGFWGRVDDMVLWAPSPAYHFTWSPANFDVMRRGGEAGLELRPLGALRLSAFAGYAAVTYARPGGAQVQYRPRVTAAASALLTRGAWNLDARWQLVGARYPNAAGVNPRPAISLVHVGVERRLGALVLLRGEVRDLFDARAEFIAGAPTPGRVLSATLNLTMP